jgi:hypothetical protein
MRGTPIERDDPKLGAAQRAFTKLEAEFGGHPDVSLIDVAYQPVHDSLMRSVVLRVHVRDRWLEAKPEDRVTFPPEVDGIPVVVTRGEYQLE